MFNPSTQLPSLDSCFVRIFHNDIGNFSIDRSSCQYSSTSTAILVKISHNLCFTSKNSPLHDLLSNISCIPSAIRSRRLSMMKLKREFQYRKTLNPPRTHSSLSTTSLSVDEVSTSMEQSSGIVNWRLCTWHRNYSSLVSAWEWSNFAMNERRRENENCFSIKIFLHKKNLNRGQSIQELQRNRKMNWLAIFKLLRWWMKVDFDSSLGCHFTSPQQCLRGISSILSKLRNPTFSSVHQSDSLVSSCFVIVSALSIKQSLSSWRSIDNLWAVSQFKVRVLCICKWMQEILPLSPLTQ